MTDRTDDTEMEDRLWKELGSDHLAMLGVHGGEFVHFKAMTPYCDREGDRVWFLTKKGVDLVHATKSGDAQGVLIFQARDGKFQASIVGKLVEDFDSARRDRYWNAAAAAYFPDGKDDPDLTMLRLDLASAELWHSEAGPVRFAWEVAKANLTKTEPDIGGKTELKF